MIPKDLLADHLAYSVEFMLKFALGTTLKLKAIIIAQKFFLKKKLKFWSKSDPKFFKMSASFFDYKETIEKIKKKINSKAL